MNGFSSSSFAASPPSSPSTAAMTPRTSGNDSTSNASRVFFRGPTLNSTSHCAGSPSERRTPAESSIVYVPPSAAAKRWFASTSS